MYQSKDYPGITNLDGFSQELVNNHIGLYDGYVKNTNLLVESVKEYNNDSAECFELRRRFGWEFNGMRLHELFFENLSNSSTPIESCVDVYNKIQLDFGSIENWQNEFRAMGLTRGIGWVVLYHDRWQDQLFNVWIEQHDSGHLAGCRPLIVMDMFEHAYLPDGLRKPDYVDKIMKLLDWQSADDRMKAMA